MTTPRVFDPSAAAENPANARHPTRPKIAATGIEGLDEVLGGGVTRKRLYLIEGPPDGGKTTIALQFLLEGTRLGESGLYITLSETEQELRSVAAAQGWSVSGAHIFEVMPHQDALRGEQQYTVFHPAEVELSETTRSIREIVDRAKPARVVFALRGNRCTKDERRRS